MTMVQPAPLVVGPVRPGVRRALAKAGGAVAAGVVLMGAAWWWFSSGSAPDDRPDVHVAAMEDFLVTASASGELRARSQTVLRSELEESAAIVFIVEEGSLVKKGDLLVKLNDQKLRTERQDAVLQRETARADVVAAESAVRIQKTENDASLKKAQTEVELAKIELRKFDAGDAVERRLELSLAVERGEREVARLTEKVDRARELLAREFLSEDEFKRDELELIEAQAQLQKARVAREAYENYTHHKERRRLESDLEQAEAELEKTIHRNESELESKEADLANKRQQLEIREAEAAELEELLAKTEIRAPTDGLVVYATSLEQFSWMNNEQALNVGSQIQPNQEIIMLPDTSEMVAAVKVHESLVGRIRPGQQAVITVDAAQGRKFTGRVETIGIMARTGGWRDPNVREYEVRIALDLAGQTHALKPSMRCEARITLQEVEDVLAVPLPAVFTEGANQFVYVVEGGKYRQTPVRVGRRSDTMVEVASGLKVGDRVVLREPPASRVIKAKFEKPASRMVSGEGAAGRRGPRPMGEAGGRADGPGAERPVGGVRVAGGRAGMESRMGSGANTRVEDADAPDHTEGEDHSADVDEVEEDEEADPPPEGE